VRESTFRRRESKPTFAVRNIDRLLPQVREQLQDYDFVKGDGSELLAWTAGVLKSTIPGTECVTLVAVSKLLIAGGAVIAVGGEPINAIEDEHEDWQVKGILKGPKASVSYSSSESSMVRTFLDAVPAESDYVLLLGYNETVHPEVTGPATQVLLTSLLSGATVSTAVGLANECYVGQYERLEGSLNKRLGYKLGKVSARLEAASRQDGFLGMRLPQLVPEGNGENE